MFLVAWQCAQMHQNLFLTTPDCNKYILYDHVPVGLAVCGNASELAFYHKSLKKTFFIIMCLEAQYVQKMHQNLL
jgi:hypothetical protein